MIDPTNITKFNRNHRQLEEVLLFWIMAANKPAMRTAKRLNEFLDHYHRLLTGITENKQWRPFELLRHFSQDKLAEAFCEYGFGCQNQKAATVYELVHSGLDLRTCTVDDLEAIKGIGPKTARCFIMHSRRDAQHAGLDTHILKWLAERYDNIPKSTPQSKKRYDDIEKLFVDEAKALGKTPADLDLEIWRKYSTN